MGKSNMEQDILKVLMSEEQLQKRVREMGDELYDRFHDKDPIFDDKNIIQRAERCPRNEFGHNVRDGFDRKINTLCRCLHATDDKFCLDAGD